MGTPGRCQRWIGVGVLARLYRRVGAPGKSAHAGGDHGLTVIIPPAMVDACVRSERSDELRKTNIAFYPREWRPEPMAQALVPPLATPRPAVRAPLGYRGSRRDTVTRAATRHDLIGARDDDDDARCPSTDSPTVDRRALLLGAAASCASMSPLASYADTFADTEDIAKNYDRYASYYDDLDGGAFASETLGLEKSRRDLLARASGDVLELGVGTGLNLPGYDLRPGGAVRSLTAVDISGGMLAQAKSRADTLGFRVRTDAEFEASRRADAEAAATAMAMNAMQAGALVEATPEAVEAAVAAARDAASRAEEEAKQPPPVRFVVADVEKLPFDDASFDCVVDTFSLCVFNEPNRALVELARVLKPGGMALLVEHSKAPGFLGAYQDAVAGPVKSLAKGCAWNQDVVGLVEATPGLRVVETTPSLFGLLTTVEAKRA